MITRLYFTSNVLIPGRTVPRSDGTASDGGPTLSLESDAERIAVYELRNIIKIEWEIVRFKI